MQITPHVRNKWDKLKTVLLGTTHLPEFFNPIKNAKIREPLKVIAEETLEEADEILTIIKPNQSEFRIILVGNKTDLQDQRNVQIWDINKWIARRRRDGWMLRHIECNRRNITSFRKILDRAINGLEMSLEPLDLTKVNPFFDKAKDQAGWMDYLMPF